MAGLPIVRGPSMRHEHGRGSIADSGTGRDDPLDAQLIEPILSKRLEQLGVDHVEWLLAPRAP
jgi:hypothetical protein